MKKRKCLKCDKPFMPSVKLTRTCEYCFLNNTKMDASEDWFLSVKPLRNAVKISELGIDDELSD